MNAEEETCNNCKLKIAAQNYVMHTLHCTRHLELCKKCGEPYPKGTMSEHVASEHADESCLECGVTMEKSVLMVHVKTDCPKRIIACPFCELELPSCDMVKHTDYCGTRTEKCSDCGELVMLKYQQLHLDSNHNFLKLEEEPGPAPSWKTKATVVTNNRTSRRDTGGDAESTLLPCEFCDGMFTPRELRRHQVSCVRGWHTTIPVLRRMSVVSCDSCHKTIPSREYTQHRIICQCQSSSRSDESPSMPKKTAIVPCDMCNKSIAFDLYQAHHIVCCQRKGLRPQSFNSNESNSRQQRSEFWRMSVVPCEICHRPVAFEEYELHRLTCSMGSYSAQSVNHSTSFDESLLELPCEFCEESFSPKGLAAHQLRCFPKGQSAAIPCEVCGELKLLTDINEHQLTCQASGDF